ncbi:MAG: restriction endonuclease subunit S [Streptosporangiaceae bacterium]|nr:restriction endonuclease subunit S [Streptosporangiaceae bacterium]
MRLKDIAYINRRVLPETTDPNYSFRYIDIASVGDLGIIAIPDQLTLFGQAPSRARRIAPAGSTVVSTVRTYLCAIAQVPSTDETLVFSTGFAVLEAKPSIDDRFLAYVCRSQPFINEVVARSVGVSYPAINPGDLSGIRVPVPPLDEQRRIADFLDAETARMDGLQGTRDRQLTALDELIASSVSAIVPSPSDVSFVRLGYLSVIQLGLTVDGGRDPGADSVTLPYLRVANVQDGHLDLESIYDITVPRIAARSSTLCRGDVLMTEGGDLDKLGRGTVWNGEIENCLHQNHVFAVRSDQTKLAPEYLALITRTAYARSYFESTGTKTTNLASTSSSKIRDFRIPLIDLTDQARVVRETESWLEEVTKVQAVLTLQRALLAERRQALITAAVTGGITV